MNHIQHYADKLERLKQQGHYRHFRSIHIRGRYIEIDGRPQLNLSSNDYLGLASDLSLRAQFFDQYQICERWMSSSSSRLLTGNFPIYEEFEQQLSQAFLGRAALLFNSGYHMNIGILPALADSKTLVLADKLVHASIIDGIRLSQAPYARYRHNDLQHLKELIEKSHDDVNVQRIIVVTESIFSMDGDETDLRALVALKEQFPKVMLYVDEAHAIGVRGYLGLGCAEQYQVMDQIDILVGTFGKALASVGGYLICHAVIRDYLINTMRPLIFSTAQAPLNIAWGCFIFQHMQGLSQHRRQLQKLSEWFKQSLIAKEYQTPTTSHIVPIILGDSQYTIDQSQHLQQVGFYILPIRPPTVPHGRARLRVCLNRLIEQQDLEQLMKHL